MISIEKQDGRGLLGLSVLLYTPILLLLLAYPLRGHHDVAFLLDTGYRVLSGQLPYVDFFEVNLPPIFYVSALPVWISQWSGTGVILVTHLLVFALTLSSAIMVDHLLVHVRKSGLTLPVSRHLVPFLVVIAILIPMLFGFGQREHLLIILFIPWLLLRWLRASGGQYPALPAFLLGIVATIGFTLKPHYIFMIIAPEMLLLLRRRRWTMLVQPEIGGALFVAIIALMYALMFPQVIDAYLTDVMPLTLAGYDVLGNLSVFELTVLNPGMYVPMLLLVVGMIVGWRKGAYALLLQSLSIALAGAIFGFAIQGKGWPYHYFPAIGLCLWITALLIARKRETVQPKITPVLDRRLVTGGLLAILMLGCIALAGQLWASLPYGSGDEDIIEVIQSHTSSTGEVMLLGTLLYEIYPTIIQAGHWQGMQRYQTAGSVELGYFGMSLADIYDEQHTPPANVQSFVDAAIASLNAPDMELVLIRDGISRFHDHQVDTYRFLMARPAFRTVLNENYRYVGNVDNYRVYVRNRL